MAHKLNRTIQNRTFLNRVDKSCIACVQWNMSSYYNEETMLATIEAHISMSDEAKSHWINRPADLAPINKMMRELKLFKEAYKELVDEVKANGYTIKEWSAY